MTSVTQPRDSTFVSVHDDQEENQGVTLNSRDSIADRVFGASVRFVTTNQIDEQEVDKQYEKSLRIDKSLKELKENIGEDLYSQLSQEDKMWIIKTEGSINLGKKYDKSDFERIADFLRSYDSRE